MVYKVFVDFDDTEEALDPDRHRRYFNALDLFDAVGMGHEKKKTSTMFIPDAKFDESLLERTLEGIRILRIVHIL